MPLIKSSSTKARQTNIKEMVASGRDPKQAVAASYSNQRRSKAQGLERGGEVDSKIMKKGGVVKKK
jgi:hypothetical protein